MATSSGRLIAGSTVSMSSIKRRNANPPQSISLICRNQIQGVPPLVLRSSSSQRSTRLWSVEAVPSAKFWDGSDDFEVAKEEEKKKSDVPAAGGKTDVPAVVGNRDIVIAAALTAALGVGNRVMYKLALIPLKHYPFFLAQLSTFG